MGNRATLVLRVGREARGTGTVCRCTAGRKTAGGSRNQQRDGCEDHGWGRKIARFPLSFPSRATALSGPDLYRVEPCKTLSNKFVCFTAHALRHTLSQELENDNNTLDQGTPASFRWFSVHPPQVLILSPSDTPTSFVGSCSYWYLRTEHVFLCFKKLNPEFLDCQVLMWRRYLYGNCLLYTSPSPRD